MMEEKEFYKYLSVFIKSKRKELKLTNEDLSYSSKTDVSKVSLLQNNKTGCNAYTLYKILSILGINIFKNNSPDIDKKVAEEGIRLIEEYLDNIKRIL